MRTLEALARHLGAVEELRSVVRTMKCLAAVSIRRYEQASVALADYARTVELGLRVLLRERRPPPVRRAGPVRPMAAVVFGSDHGLCGRFNDEVVDTALRQLAVLEARRAHRLVLAVGSRAADRLEALGEAVHGRLLLPGSVDGLTTTVQRTVLTIDAWRAERGVGRVVLFHNRRTPGTAAAGQRVDAWPPDLRRLQRRAAERWPSRCLPTFTMDPERLFASLVRQRLFVTVYRAAVESALSEQASRLAAMQSAERNIEERLEELQAEYRHRRQESITAELLDIVTGFETTRGAEAEGLREWPQSVP